MQLPLRTVIHGLYRTKWVHSHFLFGQIMHGLKSYSNGLSTHFSKSCVLIGLCNSSCLIHCRCEWTSRMDLLQERSFLKINVIISVELSLKSLLVQNQRTPIHDGDCRPNYANNTTQHLHVQLQTIVEVFHFGRVCSWSLSGRSEGLVRHSVYSDTAWTLLL